MGLGFAVIAWIVALILTGAVLYGVWLGAREPVREWRRGNRRDAALLALAVGCAILFVLAASQMVP